MVAPARARRPGAFASREADAAGSDCPFCAGQEAETPPEVLAVGPPGRVADTPGWTVRVVPNKFPAFAGPAGRQEVVVHSPRHVRSLADLGPDEIAGVAEAWKARAAAARTEGFSYVHAFVNEGRAAGASLPHSHSQLVWLPEIPPAVAWERARSRDGCVLCSLLERELADGARLVAETTDLVALCPWASRAPYELLIAPRRCEPDAFASRLLTSALSELAAAVTRLHEVEGRVPLNAWLHTAPLGGPSGHWHLELLPRTTVLAGLELGSDLYVNPLPPEEAAESLRRPP